MPHRESYAVPSVFCSEFTSHEAYARKTYSFVYAEASYETGKITSEKKHRRRKEIVRRLLHQKEEADDEYRRHGDKAISSGQ